jgi:hypothetical protein
MHLTGENFDRQSFAVALDNDPVGEPSWRKAWGETVDWSGFKISSACPKHKDRSCSRYPTARLRLDAFAASKKSCNPYRFVQKVVPSGMTKLGDGYWAGKPGAAPIEAQHFEQELFLQTLDRARGQQTYVPHNAQGCVTQNHD